MMKAKPELGRLLNQRPLRRTGLAADVGDQLVPARQQQFGFAGPSIAHGQLISP
jgi:hypothetical protein